MRQDNEVYQYNKVMSTCPFSYNLLKKSKNLVLFDVMVVYSYDY